MGAADLVSPEPEQCSTRGRQQRYVCSRQDIYRLVGFTYHVWWTGRGGGGEERRGEGEERRGEGGGGVGEVLLVQ